MFPNYARDYWQLVTLFYHRLRLWAEGTCSMLRPLSVHGRALGVLIANDLGVCSVWCVWHGTLARLPSVVNSVNNFLGRWRFGHNARVMLFWRKKSHHPTSSTLLAEKKREKKERKKRKKSNSFPRAWLVSVSWSGRDIWSQVARSSRQLRRDWIAGKLLFFSLYPFDLLPEARLLLLPLCRPYWLLIRNSGGPTRKRYKTGQNKRGKIA